MSLSTIILAGGKSSRMGTDKALININGVPLLSRICHIALSCTSPVYLVTTWPDKYQFIIPNSCTIITEFGDNNGPLIGFYQGLISIPPCEWVLLLACDLPHLNSTVLQDWILQLNHVDQGAIALLPSHAKGWHPLCGFYRYNCFSLLEKFIKNGEKSFQKWLQKYHVQELKVDDQKVLFNCNTPEDLAAIVNP
ncbi:MAG TPA: molybdenum cofactor guanylyltransferase [Allocoleopsis sp.]